MRGEKMIEKNLDGVFIDLLDDEDDLVVTKEPERDTMEEITEMPTEEPTKETSEEAVGEEAVGEEESGVKLFVPIKEGTKIENPDLVVKDDVKADKNVEVLMKKLQNTVVEGPRAVLQKII